MGKTDIRKENRQQSDNAESDRSMEKRSILKIKKNFLAGVSLLIFLLLAVKVVQAIELGGFDVDMGTESFEDDSSWDQEETTGGTTSSDNDNYDSNNNWSNTEDSWNTGDDSSGAGAGSYTTGNTNTAQPETDWNDFFSADSYEDGTSNNNTVSQNNSSETDRAAEHQNRNDSHYNNENTEQQIADISPTPIPSPTPTMTPIPSISPTPTPVSEIQKNILTVPQKEEELTEEECRQKMQLIYCRKEIRNAAEAEIIPDRSRVIAVVSIRINGKEADWHWRSSRILLKLNPQEMQTEIETAIMCRKELSWTEAKKNAILTYNIF